MPNQIVNPDFETNTVGWGGTGTPAVLTRSTAQFHSGAASMLISNSADNDGAAASANITGILSSSLYEFTAWVYPLALGSVRLGWNELDSSSVYILTQQLTWPSLTANTWQWIKLQGFSTNAKCDRIQPFIAAGSPFISFHCDDLYLDIYNTPIKPVDHPEYYAARVI